MPSRAVCQAPLYLHEDMSDIMALPLPTTYLHLPIPTRGFAGSDNSREATHPISYLLYQDDCNPRAIPESITTSIRILAVFDTHLL